MLIKGLQEALRGNGKPGMTMRRRNFTAGLATSAAVLGEGGRTLAQAADPHEAALAELYAKAKAESGVTWYVAYWPSDRAEKHAALFRKAYPGIPVNVVRTTAQVAFQRLSQDIRANVANCDVFASTDMSHYVALKQMGQLLPYKPLRTDAIDPRFRDVDPDQAYQIANASTVGFGFNTRQIKPADVPSGWKGFVDPKWRGKLVVGHPGFSGFVGTWVVQMTKMFGWEYFEQLAALKPHVGRSIIDTVTVLSSGERSLGASPASLVLHDAAAGSPVAPAYPEDGSVLMISGSGIMKSTKSPNAARLFMEFLYGRETAGEDVEEFDLPLRTDVALPPGYKSLADLKTVRPSVEEITKELPELTEKWRDTFGV